MVRTGSSRGATSCSAGVIDRSGQAHMRGLVTSRPLFVAGLAFWSRARPGFGEAGLPIAPTRGPVNGDAAAFVFARSAPAAARTPLCELGIQLRVAASQ